MKAYTITVNGVAYDVTVEERAAGAAPVAPAPVVMAAPVAPAPAPVSGTRTCGSRRNRGKGFRSGQGRED